MPAALPMPDRIAQSASAGRKFAVHKAQFGDGYKQLAPRGLNPITDMWQVSYENLDADERDELLDVLNSVGAWDYLTWQSPIDSASKNWNVSEDSLNVQEEGLHWTISFTLEEQP